MFRGEYHNLVDDKGRLSIPAKFRELISSQHVGPLVVTLGLDPCLWLYPGDTWKKNEEQLSRLNPFDADARQLVRAFLGSSEECDLDKQGRIVISPVLRRAAGLNRNVVLVGLLNRVEIWDKEKYESYRNQAAGSLESLAQKLAEKGPAPDLTL